MEGSKNFLLQGFSTVSTLKSGANGITEIVKGLDEHIYVRKRIPLRGLPYEELQKLECRYWPQIYFVHGDDVETIVIEEYISGQSLQELVDNGTVLTSEQVRQIGLQLCQALITLHAAEILHRDIKPSNIMQTADGAIKLIDFGAARIMGTGTQDTRLLGTPGFAPPEQFGFAATDKRSDVYALGKTLQVLADKNVSKQLAVVIAKCTELDPERRLASAEELQKLLMEHKPGYKKYVAFFLAALVLGGGALWYQQRYAAPQEQTPQQQMQEQNSDRPISDKEAVMQEQNSDKFIANKEAAIQEQESKEDKQGKSAAPFDDNVVSVEQNDVDVLLSQASKQVDVEEKSTIPNTEILASDVGFYAQKWVFEKEASSLYWKNIEKARTVGAVNVKLEGVPYLVIENKSDKVIHNPYIILDFYDIEVDGKNEVYEIYGNRKEFIEYGKRSKLGYKRIVFRMQGTVLPHDEHAQAVGGDIYLTGNNPRFNVTLMVENKVLLRDTVKVAIKD